MVWLVLQQISNCNYGFGVKSFSHSTQLGLYCVWGVIQAVRDTVISKNILSPCLMELREIKEENFNQVAMQSNVRLSARSVMKECM